MMSDIFLEQLVPRKKTTGDKVKIGLIIFGGTIFSIFMLLVLFAYKVITFDNEQMRNSGQFVVPFGFLLIAFAWYGIYLLINTFNVEYEYVIVNNDLDIDKVMSKKGRKHLVSVDIKNATLMARIDDEENNSIYKNPPEGVKILNYSAMSNSGFTYFIDCSVEDERKIILWQPTQKMVEALWKYNPRAVKKYNEE
ncbi:MAG: hypothetical protein J1G06_04055 [Oscillospiraceae bacterium]|nr:hypothetical protein [Oscillospiraceae bacterium]